MFKKLLLLLLLISLPAAAYCDSAMTQTGGILCLVNREASLDKTYEPDDLIKPDVPTRKDSLQDRIYMRPEAAHALEKMFSAALTEKGYTLLAVSGYRSYGYQQVLFNQKKAAVGASKASETVAKAGESEHQLALAMDVQCADEPNLSEDFADTKEGQWVALNAHRFGYIIRYKDEWSDITGYAYEPWHLRYIGVAHATAVYLLDIPYEIYYEQMIKLPSYVIEEGNPYLLAGVIGDLIGGDESVLTLFPDTPEDIHTVLKSASNRYLPPAVDYQQAVWLGYPTPAPTSPPRVDQDTDEATYEEMIRN